MNKYWYLTIGIIIGLAIGGVLVYTIQNHEIKANPATNITTFNVGAAGTLKFSFSQLLSIYSNYFPSVQQGSPFFAGSGEVAQKEVTTKSYSIVAAADTSTIPSVLFPANLSDYEIAFGYTQMTIIVDLNTPYGREVYSLWNQSIQQIPYSDTWNDTWRNIFNIIALNPNTVVGVSNPFTDPSGYQAQCMLKLAGLTFYGNSSYLWSAIYSNPSKYIMRNTETDLLSLMTANNTVQFILSAYLSNAIPQVQYYQQNGYNITYITLPSAINLGDLSYVNYYKQVNVTWTQLGTTKTFSCKPVIYTITIPSNVQNKQASIDFILLIYSPIGQQVLKSFGIRPINPGIIYGNYTDVPQEIKIFTIPLDNVTNMKGLFPG
ncbi:substrate-binding domain-containing protein [Fervidicoccus sp.]|uniref:substrate-binding domain-containing protein n=1 Tax=Fervidicoccus sp. TaxID=2060324 RepID=UPI003D0EBB93